MRKNVFLHFINRDSREIFGLDRFHGSAAHVSILKRALNLAVLICEDYCVMPPGFAIEDELAFELFEVNRAFLAHRLILLPMRERNLTEFAEKKRLEYFPKRDRYSGLFSDKRLEFLGQNAPGLIPRKSRISEEIVSGWQAAADNARGRLWTDTKKIILPKLIETIRAVPARLAADGVAVTWAEISPLLPEPARQVHGELRNSLQSVYFRQYCNEFGLMIICELPFARDEFALPTERKVYSFARLTEFLEVFNLRELILGCSADTLIALKRCAGMLDFLDAYEGVARLAGSITDLRMRAIRARQSSKFNWGAFAERNRSLITEPVGFAVAELSDALAEVSSVLNQQNGLIRRLVKPAETSERKREVRVQKMTDILLYIALDEEIEVLVKRFNLVRNARNPVVTGQINGTDVGVLSARAMGRVPAAIEVARYLESQKNSKPRLIMIVGLAGGFEEEGTTPGHIICATVVSDLASRKLQGEDEGTKVRFRRRDYHLDDSLAAVLKSDGFNMEEWRAMAIDEGDWPQDRRPSLHYGPVASVDEVIASDEWRSKLQGATEKLLGVEMEAGGVCAAADIYRVPVVMLRAVSDNADPIKTDDEWRRRGLKTIAALLANLNFGKLFEAMQT